MPQVGAHAIIGFYINKFLKTKKWLYVSIIFGSILPDVDTIIVGFSILFTDINNPFTYFHRKATHSFFLVIIIYLVCMILSEIYKNQKYKTIGIGLSIGMISHIIADTFFFFQGIYFLWPINYQFNLWNDIYSPTPLIKKLIFTLEFLFFRIYAWILLQLSIITPAKNIWFHKPLIIWKNVMTILFIIFLVIAIMGIPVFTTLTSIAYIISLIVTIYSTWILRDVFK